MKNWLTIDLEKFSRISNEFDYLDAAIFDFLYHICASMHPNIEGQRINEDGDTWSWTDYTHLMDQLPLLHINSTSAISKRIRKLEEKGLLNTRREGNQKLFVKMTSKGTDIFLNSSGYHK